MMKRIPALLLALCILCGVLSGCDVIGRIFGVDISSPPDESGYETVTGMRYRCSAYYTPVTTRYAYALLNSRQQYLYDQVLAQMFIISPDRNTSLGNYAMKSVRVDGQLSVAEMRITIRALSNDNPYFFWLSQTFSHGTDNDENYTMVIPYSEFSPDALRRMLSKLDLMIDGFYGSVDSGLSAYEREKLVHDYIIDTCEYNDSVADRTDLSEENIRAHCVYGALIDHSCVCEGYGMAMQLLLNGLGVECVTLTGESYDSSDEQDETEAVLHLWNAVQLDGDWYHVDPTWDDQDQQMQRYYYFNLTDEAMLRDHTLSGTPDELNEATIADNGTEDMNLYIPSCTGTAYNYYACECPHLSDYRGYDVTQALYQAAAAKEPYFTFYIEPDRFDFDDAVRQLFREWPQYFFDYAEDVNSRLYNYEIDNRNLTYYAVPERSMVTVSLRYY